VRWLRREVVEVLGCERVPLIEDLNEIVPYQLNILKRSYMILN
jgi:hypothetical protein